MDLLLSFLVDFDVILHFISLRPSDTIFFTVVFVRIAQIMQFQNFYAVK